MTVLELIAALKKLPPNLNVYADVGYDPDDDREVTGADAHHTVACNDAICRYVRLSLGGTA